LTQPALSPTLPQCVSRMGFHIEALGGKLEVNAVFDERRVRLKDA
jgi:hypothetical protein